MILRVELSIPAQLHPEIAAAELGVFHRGTGGVNVGLERPEDRARAAIRGYLHDGVAGDAHLEFWCQILSDRHVTLRDVTALVVRRRVLAISV